MYQKKEKKLKTKKAKTQVSFSKLKKEFYKNKKNFQNQREKQIDKQDKNDKNDINDKSDIKEFEDEFNKSLGFLQNIMSTKNSKNPIPIKLGVPKTFNI